MKNCVVCAAFKRTKPTTVALASAGCLVHSWKKKHTRKALRSPSINASIAAAGDVQAQIKKYMHVCTLQYCSGHVITTTII